MITVTLGPVTDFRELGARWRALEARADASFFQSWTWTGCLAAERFPNPMLATARDGDTIIGLALFNRRRGPGRPTLHLGETGTQPWNRLFIEHNGPLVVADRADEVTEAMLRAAGAGHDLVLGGCGDATLAAARGAGGARVLRTLPVPFATPDARYRSRRSANTRQQISRSDRAFGTLAAARAISEEQAHAWLDEMAALHQATWTERGEPGCFADPSFGRFHHALIQLGLPRGEIALRRFTAAGQVIGILYNFRFRGREMAYQSGFRYDPGAPRRKPGLTCHHQAIQACAEDGMTCYDFLAGDDRYKRSLADGETSMHWVLAGRWWSPRLLVGWCSPRVLTRWLLP